MIYECVHTHTRTPRPGRGAFCNFHPVLQRSPFSLGTSGWVNPYRRPGGIRDLIGCLKLKAGARSQPAPSLKYYLQLLSPEHLAGTSRTSILERRKPKDEVTSPRSHSQEVALAGFTSPCPVCPLTWPPWIYGPHSPPQPVAEPGTPRSEPRVKFPAPLDWRGQTLPPSLPCGQVRPAARPLLAPSLGPDAGARSAGELEEGRRAPAKCSAGAASSPGRWTGLHPLHRREDEERRGGTGSPSRGNRPGNAGARLPPRSRRLQNFPAPALREPERLPGAERAHQLRGTGSRPPSPGSLPCPALPWGSPALLPPGSAVPRPGGSVPTPRAPRLSGRGTYSASPRSSSPQPAKWPAGTHLQEGETEARRGSATGPRSHSAAARSRAIGRGLGAPSQPAVGSLPCPRGILTAGLAHELPHLLGGGVGSAHGARGGGPGARVPRRPRAGVDCAAAGPASGPPRVGTPGTGLSRGFRVGRERGLL